jgi:hypothetical protein
MLSRVLWAPGVLCSAAQSYLVEFLQGSFILARASYPGGKFPAKVDKSIWATMPPTAMAL